MYYAWLRTNFEGLVFRLGLQIEEETAKFQQLFLFKTHCKFGYTWTYTKE